MKIRPARREEAPIILQLIKDLAEYEKAPDQVAASETEILNTIFAENPKVFCDLVEVDNQIAGMAIWFLNYSTWLGKAGLYLEDLFVKPEFRGKGIGLEFMKTLARICIERGYERFQWWVLDWNEPSINFYKSIGAEAMSDWTVYRLSGSALSNFAASSTSNF